MRLSQDFERMLQNIAQSEKGNEIGNKSQKMLNEFQNGNKMCLLNKSLYGPKQSGRSWYNRLKETLKKYEATPTNADPYLFHIIEPPKTKCF